MKIVRIISGGQTGADRAALDAAIACGVPHGGWCPKGRLAEDGQIPERYHLQESGSEEYAVRTRRNVEAADLTVVFSHGPLTGGSLLTQQFADELRKPCLHLDLNENFQGLEKKFPTLGSIVLNVAGSRASDDSAIYDAVYTAVVELLNRD